MPSARTEGVRQHAGDRERVHTRRWRCMVDREAGGRAVRREKREICETLHSSIFVRQWPECSPFPVACADPSPTKEMPPKPATIAAGNAAAATVVQLKAFLADRSEPVDGLKADLVARVEKLLAVRFFFLSCSRRRRFFFFFFRVEQEVPSRLARRVPCRPPSIDRM